MESGALIELHAHILPQMDDGSESVEMSLAMLQALAEMGVGAVCATSHYYARENSITMYLARRAAALNALHSAIPAGSSLPRILPAAEAAYFRGMEEHHPERLCIENTRTLMLEMPFSEWTDQQGRRWRCCRWIYISMSCSSIPSGSASARATAVGWKNWPSCRWPFR